jgi:membrane dipeptidase
MRMHTDQQLRMILERGGVVGLTLFNAHLVADYRRPPHSEPDSVSLSHVVDHADHICQIAGSAGHVAIGSDLDGGFGCEHTPRGIDTIADLPRLASVLHDRGFADDDVAGFLGGNWLRFWRSALPGE